MWSAGLLLGIGSLTVGAAPAFASCSVYGPSTCSAPSGTPPTPSATPSATPSYQSSSSLAFTGADVELSAAVAAGAVATGGLLVLAGRRRRSIA